MSLGTILGLLLPILLQLITMWMTRKNESSDLDKKLLEWIRKKNKDAVKSVKIKKQVEAALKWAKEHPVVKK